MSRATDSKSLVAVHQTPKLPLNIAFVGILTTLNGAWDVVKVLDAKKEQDFLKAQVAKMIENIERIVKEKEVLADLRKRLEAKVDLIKTNPAFAVFLAAKLDDLIRCLKDNSPSPLEAFREASILEITGNDQLDDLLDHWIDFLDFLTTEKAHSALIIQVLNRLRTLINGAKVSLQE